MTTSTELVAAESINPVVVFGGDGLDSVLEQIAAEAKNMVPDLTTVKGRKEIASMANKVARSKVLLDNLGKDLVAGRKAELKKVDEERKRMRDTLDALKSEVRQPLTEWEEEQERIKAEEAARAEAEKLAAQIETDHEISLLLNEKHDREKAEEAERIRIEKQQHEERIALEAKEAAEREAKARFEAEQQARINAERAAKEAEERAKQQAIDAEAARLKAVADAEAAERKAKEDAERYAIEAEQRAKEQAEAAAQRERDLIARQQQAELEAKQKREANKKHKAVINNAALLALIENAGLTEDQAKATVVAIAKGVIPAITINY